MAKTLVVTVEEQSGNDPTLATLEDIELVAVSESFEEPQRRSIRLLFRQCVVRALTRIACASARHPKRTIFLSVTLALLLAVTGYFTNANFSIDTDQLWTPSGTVTQQREIWIKETFPKSLSTFNCVFHGEGTNVLNSQLVQRMFDALESIQQIPQYNTLCESGACRVYGATGFWNHIRPANVSDTEAIRTMSSLLVNDGSGYTIPTPRDQFFSQLEKNGTSLLSATAARLVIRVPDMGEITKEWERHAIQRTLELRQEEGEDIFVEVLGETSIPDELVRALEVDLPLVPIVVALMSICSCMLLGLCLGVAAIAAVVLSILAGAGTLCIIGVPWTSATQLVPFLILGIGLDDAIILCAAWRRVSSSSNEVLSIEDRVRQTLESSGLSIFLTTLTSVLAFSLGGVTSSVPAIYWLCQYCAPTITLVLVYQLTFFIACLVETDKPAMSRNSDPFGNVRPPFLDKYMERYANGLLGLPRITKIFVILLLFGFAGFCASRIPHLTQELRLEELLPRNSYASAFLEAEDQYSDAGGQLIPIDTYFVGYDVSNATIRDQLQNRVVDELINHGSGDFVGPVRSWMEAFELYKAFGTDPSVVLTENSFRTLLEQFLKHPLYGSIFGDDIAFKDGGITASRVSLWMAIDRSDVDRLLMTFEIANNFATDTIFTHNKIYNVWEFYSKVFSEVVTTTALGIVAVSIVSLAFVPRWGAIHVISMICLLYADLVGVVQLSGLHLNGITFVCLTMSIGLLVDFCLHLILRFEEGPSCCRDMLKSMGSSVLMGGTTTLLGIVPLAFSTSQAFRTVFIVFLGIVTLGVSHGLILLPLILDAMPQRTKPDITLKHSTRGSML